MRLICLVKIVLIMLVTSGGLLVVLVVGFVWWWFGYKVWCVVVLMVLGWLFIFIVDLGG